MPDGLKGNVKLFADDTSIFSSVKNKNGSDKILSMNSFNLKMGVSVKNVF